MLRASVVRSEQLVEVVQGLIHRADAGVAVSQAGERGAVQRRRDRGAGVIDDRDEVAEVACVAGRGLDAFVGIDTADI